MPMDPDLVNQMNNAHARGIAAGAGVDVVANQTMQQLGVQIAVTSQFDQRLLSGFLTSQLFNLDLVESKAAYHTPTEPAAAPLPTPPAK